MATSSLLLVGAGQLGSRYLQGMAFVDRQLEITIIDPSPKSLDLARQSLAELSADVVQKMHFSTSLAESPKHFDLAIVATPAHCRADVVASIAARHEVSAWILEKLLAQSSHQLDQIEHALNNQPQVWVNTPRRVMSWHQAIKRQLLACGSSVLRVQMSGGQWGLACNAIHFIDLASWWTGSVVNSVDCSGLDDWSPSKRSGFQEVFGTLSVSYGNGSSLELSCNKSDVARRIEVETSEGIWLIDEAAGQAIGPSGQEIAGKLSLQSTLTAPLVNKILTAGCCELPSFADSSSQHRPFLDALLHHWNHSQSLEDSAVPIT